ncbi:ATP-binding cassette sub-family A member 3-like isoform X1 [Lingula anatina]|uniref:ATP-binding cassette sub-family A member 3-like isoform X1 n=1 Tax=Lingula anatina TaxID=7574 RepID=A0A1S3IA19_LINAN|nr:ATP-binding cassette sub-family A member 3-like isoform X1 [Lingula anatina]|eukprot:XP_013395102.1 ATP-binding cassette sub-family A member 3-like isoform X1 [Lingula anatina]
MINTPKDPFIATVATDDSPWARNISGVYRNVVATVTKSPSWNQTVDQFLLDTQRKIDSIQFANEYMIGVSYEIDEDGCNISTGLYNGYAYHSMPLALNLVNNALLRYLAGDEYSISVNNHPLPSYDRHMDNDLMDGEDDVSGNDSWKWWPPIINLTYTCIFLCVMSALLGSFAISPVEERTNETKLLLFVSGSTGMTYWLSRCCWDITIYSVPVISVIGLVLAGQTWPLYIADRQQETLIILVVLFGWATLPLTYLLSFKFDTGLTASRYIMIMFTTIGAYSIVLKVLILYIVPYRQLQVAELVTSFSYPEITDWIFTVLFPPFNLVGGLLNFYINDYNSRYCLHSNTTMSQIQCNLGSCVEWNKNQTAIPLENRTLYFCMPHVNNTLSFQNPGFGRHALFLFIQGFAFLVILIIVETHVLTTWYKVRQTKGFRTSISSETFQYSYGSTSRSNMTNTLKSEQSKIKTAQPFDKGPVQVSIRKGEAIGILGLDDRGKETLFRMLTGDVLPSDGTSFLEGVTFDSYNGKQVRLHVGYCPKSCSLIGELTCREMLCLIGRLRGVTETDLEHVIDDVIECCLLTSQASDVIDSCSAGTKRKLSTAIALIGKPTIIFLDEPTTSVDPLCRRKIWSVLQEIRRQGTTLVLTTSSTEESEMQCTRVPIMIDQRFVTMGSPQSLKNVYGDGVNIEIRLTDEEEIDTEDLISFITSRLPGGHVTKENNFIINFKVLNEHIRWGQLFQTLEEARTRFTMVDYSIQQCTLEAAFLHLSRSFVAPTSVDHSEGTRSFVL